MPINQTTLKAKTNYYNKNRAERVIKRAIKALNLSEKKELTAKVDGDEVSFRKYPTASYDYIITINKTEGASRQRQQYFYNTLGYWAYKETNGFNAIQTSGDSPANSVFVGAKAAVEDKELIREDAIACLLDIII